MGRLRLCVVAPHGTTDFFLARGTEKKPSGGAELQSYNLAQAMRTEFEVHFIVEARRHERIHSDDLTLHVAYFKDQGIRRLRYIHPRMTGLWRAMHHADADIYYQRGAGASTGHVALFCKLFRRTFIYGMANDNEILYHWNPFSLPTDRWLYQLGRRWADLVIVQNRFQQQSIVQCTALLPSIYTGTLLQRKPRGEYILTVGHLLPKKRTEWVLEAARRYPNLSFRIVGSQSGPYVQDLLHQASQLPNVQLLGSLSREATHAQYRKASLLLHASRAEGFPNVFLEAWAHQVPVLSVGVDPDQVITTHGLGWVASGQEDWLTVLGQIVSERALLRQRGRAGLHYVRSHHTVEALQKQYCETFASAARGPR
jgi:glycosyltransferase involved in cell wall biosynthesis